MISKILAWIDYTPFWELVHLALAAVWALAIPAAFIFGWWEAIWFVVLCSVYANFVGHWSSWQAARAGRSGAEKKKAGDAK